jgi:hypothetical protein
MTGQWSLDELLMTRKGLRTRFAVVEKHEFEFDNFSTQTCNTKDEGT